MDWMKSLTMEQTFIVTGFVILLIAIPVGFLLERIFRKENERNSEDG